jgi:hypothetical protein
MGLGEVGGVEGLRANEKGRTAPVAIASSIAQPKRRAGHEEHANNTTSPVKIGKRKGQCPNANVVVGKGED